MSDLARAIDLPVEFDFMAVSSYGIARHARAASCASSRTSTSTSPTATCCIVEDIVDSGLTLAYLRRNLAARGPASLEVCALLVKDGLQRVDLDLKLRRLHDPADVRRRLRPRRRRAVPQPARTSPSTRDPSGLSLRPSPGSRSGAQVACRRSVSSRSAVTKQRRSLVIVVVVVAVVAAFVGCPRLHAAATARRRSRSTSTTPKLDDGKVADGHAARQGPHGHRHAHATAPSTRSTSPSSTRRELTQHARRRRDRRSSTPTSQSQSVVAQPRCYGLLPFVLLVGLVLMWVARARCRAAAAASWASARRARSRSARTSRR